jgi:hypothetical protein
MASEFCLRNISIHARKVLLHAVNLRHGTFTSPPKEIVLRIFITVNTIQVLSNSLRRRIHYSLNCY